MGDMIRNINYTITTGKIGINNAHKINVPNTTYTPDSQNTADVSFKKLLNEKLSANGKNEELTFSKHAKVRTSERNITLDQNDMTRLNNAVGKAKEKGLGDTLILMNDNAFIVNVPNNVVVTVVDSVFDGKGNNENVFTNIDGAVIA